MFPNLVSNLPVLMQLKGKTRQPSPSSYEPNPHLYSDSVPKNSFKEEWFSTKLGSFCPIKKGTQKNPAKSTTRLVEGETLEKKVNDFTAYRRPESKHSEAY